MFVVIEIVFISWQKPLHFFTIQLSTIFIWINQIIGEYSTLTWINQMKVELDLNSANRKLIKLFALFRTQPSLSHSRLDVVGIENG